MRFHEIVRWSILNDTANDLVVQIQIGQQNDRDLHTIRTRFTKLGHHRLVIFSDKVEPS